MYSDMYGQPPGRNPMAVAALILGILSMICFTVFYIALPCGALAVILAILSRSRTAAMSAKGKIGIACGICGMVVSVIVTVSAIHYVFTDPEGRAYLEYFFQVYTGDSDFDLDEELGEIFPFLGDSTEDRDGSPEDGILEDDLTPSEPSQGSPSWQVPDEPAISDEEGVFL